MWRCEQEHTENKIDQMTRINITHLIRNVLSVREKMLRFDLRVQPSGSTSNGSGSSALFTALFLLSPPLHSLHTHIFVCLCTCWYCPYHIRYQANQTNDPCRVLQASRKGSFDNIYLLTASSQWQGIEKKHPEFPSSAGVVLLTLILIKI